MNWMQENISVRDTDGVIYRLKHRGGVPERNLRLKIVSHKSHFRYLRG